MDEEGFKKTCFKEKTLEKGRHSPAFLRYMAHGSRLHAEIGCRKVYAGEVSE